MDKNVYMAVLGAVLVIAIGLAEASTKKGYSIEFNDFLCDDVETFGDMNWWYDWHLHPFWYDDEQKPNCPNHNLTVYDHSHYSMKRGRFWYSAADDYVLRDYASVLLGFNEPNNYEQARMYPHEAAEQWPQIEAIATSNGRNLPIASPAAAPCGSPDPTKCLMDTVDWFNQFYGNCTEMHGDHGCKVDYTATHWYGCKKSWLIGMLNQLYTRYGLPIWLTEFACPDPDPAVVLAFMQDILPRLENTERVHKYAWFVSRIGDDSGYVKSSSSLLKPDSSELTELGQFYVDFQ